VNNLCKNKLLLSSLLLWPLVSNAESIEHQLTGFNDEQNCQNNYTSIAEKLNFDLLFEIDPITPGFAILEGPIWLDGSLVMSHIGYKVDGENPADRIAYRDGEIKTIQGDYLSNGLTFNHLGHVVAARHADGSITGVENGRIFADEYQGARFNSPNDLVFSADGNLYFTDPDWQAPENAVLQAAERGYHVNPWGAVSAFGEGVIDKPNGVMLSKDEQTLYVGGTNGVFKFAIGINGEVIDNAEQVLAEEIPAGVDGMSRDHCGNIFIAANGKINIMSSDEAFIGSQEIPGITNVAFGGESGRDIYVTTLGGRPAVYRAQNQWPVAGLPY